MIMREEDMTTALIPALQNMPLSAGNLDAYIRQIHGIPVLTAEDERELALRLEQQNDLEAAQKLIMSNLRFVVKMARGLRSCCRKAVNSGSLFSAWRLLRALWRQICFRRCYWSLP